MICDRNNKRSKTVIGKIVLVLSLFAFSCDDIENNWERPNDMSSYIPDYCIQLIGSHGISGKVAYFNYTPSIYGDFDLWQLKIKSIDYYIDDELIKTDTQEPYSFKFSTVLSEGKHKLNLNVKIVDLVNNKEIVIHPMKEFEVKSSGNSENDTNQNPSLDDGLLMNASWSYSGNDVYINVNSLELTTILKNAGWVIKEVDYYLDEKLLETVTEEPFVFYYHVEDLKLGAHPFLAKAKVVNSSNGKETELINAHEINIKRGYNFYLDLNQYVKNGEPLTAKLFLLEKRSDPGCQIKSVTYYVDDLKIGVVTKAPYEMSYNLPEDDKTHTLTAYVSYTDGTKAGDVTMRYTDIQHIKSTTWIDDFGVKGSHYFFVGDLMECFAKVYLGEKYASDDTLTEEVKFYLDDTFLGESTTFPYTCEYEFSATDVGKHKLRIECSIYENSRLIDKKIDYIDIIVSD